MPRHYVLIAIVALGLNTTTFAQAKNEPVGKRTAVIISKIDESVVNEFKKAWLLSGSGFAKTEALVLLYERRDGSILARSQPKSGEYKQFTFRWTADIIAVVHTHAKDDVPEPVGQDLQVADRFGIPVFTITQFGMYVYDPDTKKTSRVQQGLDWLKSTKWNHDRQPVAQR